MQERNGDKHDDVDNDVIGRSTACLISCGVSPRLAVEPSINGDGIEMRTVTGPPGMARPNPNP